MKRATSTVPPFEPAPRPADLPSPAATGEQSVARMTAGFDPAQESALLLYLLVGLGPAVASIREAVPRDHLGFAPLLALGLPQHVRVGLACAIYDGARRGVRDYLAACHRAGIDLPGLADAAPAGGPVEPASLAALGFPVAGPTASLVARLAGGGQRPPPGARFAVGPVGEVTDIGAPDREGSAGDSSPADPA